MSSPVINLPFVIGNDICRVARIRRILQGRLGPRFVRRVLTAEEMAEPGAARILRYVVEADAAVSTPVFSRAVEFMAGRFAAKEAVIKAHPYRRLTFQGIEIFRVGFSFGPETGTGSTGGTGLLDEDTDGPRLDDDGVSASPSGPLVAFIRACGAFADSHASVSISHDAEYATAVCLGGCPAVPIVRVVDGEARS